MPFPLPPVADVSLLRTALDCAPGALILLETDEATGPPAFRVVLLNRAAERLTGHSEDQLLGLDGRQVLAPLLPDSFWEKATNVVATGESHHETHWLPGPEGDTRLYDVTLCPHPSGVAISFQDITRYENQRSLLEAVVENSTSGIVVEKALRDPAGEVIDFQAVLINPQALQFGKHTREEALSRTIRQLNPRFESSGLLDAYRNVLTTGKPFRVEFFHEPVQRWLELSASRMDGEQLVVLFNDTTERRLAAQEVERQKNLLDGILRTSPNGVVVYEAVHDAAGDLADFRIVLVNAQGRSILGRWFTEMEGRTMIEMYAEAKSKGLWNTHAEVYRTGQSHRTHHFYPDHGWFDMSINKLGDGIVLTFTDIGPLKRAEQEIMRRNDLLQGVMDASLSAVSVWQAIRGSDDPAGEIEDFELLMMNERAYATSPLPREHLEKARTLLEIYPDSKTTGTFAERVKVVETGTPFQQEVYYADLDRWYDLSMTKLGDGALATYLEITDRKRAELALQEQARLFERVLDQVQNGLSVLEAVRNEAGEVVDWRYLAVAQTNLNDTGLTRRDFLENTMTTLFPSVTSTDYWPTYREVLATGVHRRFEVHYSFDGYDNYLDNSISRLDENRVISVYTIVNEQKRAMREVERQAQYIEQVLNGSMNGVLAYEAIRDERGQLVDLRIVRANAAAAAITGVPVDQMVGSTMKTQYPTADESGLFARYAHTVDTGEPQRFQTPYYYDGLQGWFDITVSQLGDGMVMSFLDITESKQLQFRLEQLVEDLRRSNRDLEQFAYVASHDLQEPLRKIQTFGERLHSRYRGQLGPDGELYLDRMLNAAARQSLLIDNLLAFSRATRQADKFARKNLNLLVEAVLSDLEIRLTETGAEVEISPLPDVEAVPGQMQQLFQNLVTNALKFTRPGVPPRIRIHATTATPDERAAHHLDPGRHYVKLCVEDNGIGFEAEYAEQIFVIFKRLHGRAEYEGTGIGLAIVKKIVENHGGVVYAEGYPGQGAVFTVLLPLTQAR
jgi:PAS domain S-box-containing protein